jgi:putative NADH-flavin reductase
MNIVIFGANGPTGLELCRQALAAGHHVTGAVRRPGEFPLKEERLAVVQANVMDDTSLIPVIEGAEAVLSALGTAYSRQEVRIYSVSTNAIVEAMREDGHCRRLVVVSSGLTFPPPKGFGFFQDWIIFPLVRNVFGKTLYADMARMEQFLDSCEDIDWTIMRPARLIDQEGISNYRLDGDFPRRAFTSRADLAAAMVAELGPDAHIRQRVSPTTR